MELIKHSLLTESIITERANQLFKVHAESFSEMEQDCLTNIHTESEPEALNGLLMRQYKYGILGRLDEGEMLIEDFYSMERFAALEALYMNYPFGAFNCSETSIIGTIQLAAAARHEVNIANGVDMEYWYCLENDFTDVDGTIALNELAALADITLQSIRNEISLGKTQFNSLSGENGQYVSVQEAKEWLKKKSGFKPTLRSKEERELGKIEMRDNTVYVPVAKDGSFLSKDCKMTRGYQVGEKGSQQYFESLIDARDFLLTMQKARWRRPNAKGNFGIVSAKEWRFIDRDDVL